MGRRGKEDKEIRRKWRDRKLRDRKLRMGKVEQWEGEMEGAKRVGVRSRGRGV